MVDLFSCLALTTWKNKFDPCEPREPDRQMLFFRCHLLVKDVFDVVGTDGIMDQSSFKRVNDRCGSIIVF